MPHPRWYQVGPQFLSLLLDHPSIWQLLRWHHKHQLSQRYRPGLPIKDQAHHRPSIISSTLCLLKYEMTLPHGLKQSWSRTTRGECPWYRTNWYICQDHIHLNAITHRQKEEDQSNKKVGSLSHILIRHVNSNPTLYAHRERQMTMSWSYQPQSAARLQRNKTSFPIPSYLGHRHVLVIMSWSLVAMSWSSFRLSRCYVSIAVVSWLSSHLPLCRLSLVVMF